MRFGTPVGRMIVEFTTSHSHSPELGFTRLFLDGNEIGDFTDLNALTFFLAQLRDPATLQIPDEMLRQDLRADRILRAMVIDEDLEDGARLELGEAFDGLLMRRLALGKDQVFVYSTRTSPNVYVAVIEARGYHLVTEAAWQAHVEQLAAGDASQ